MREIAEKVLEKADITPEEINTPEAQQKIIEWAEKYPDDMRVVFNSFKNEGIIAA